MNKQNQKIYEIAIIGGGAAGLYLANKFKDKENLTLIESGPKDKFHKKNKNHRFIIPSNLKHRLNTDQVSGIGGNTNIWGGQLLPFTECDINRNNGWPVSWNEISKIYDEIIEELLGEKIDFYSQEYIQTSTKTKVLESKNDFFKVHVSSWLQEPNFKKKYLKKIFNNIEIFHEHYVNYLDYKKNQYYELFCFHKGDKKIIKAKKVIIACGAIQSVRLLMNSHRISNLISNSNLGKGFMDHGAIQFSKIKVHNRYKFLSFFNTKYSSYGNKLSIRISASKQYLKNKNSNISGMFMIIPPKNIFKKIINILTIILTIKFLRFIYKPYGDIVLCFLVEQNSSLKNNIELTNSGIPLINWQISKKEVHSISNFAEIILNANEVKELIKNIEEFPDKDSIYSKMTDNNHPMGGAVMHIDKSKRVVDSNLEVVGCPGLFICSTAVFPSGSHSNPTMTLLAFANRLAAKLNK